MIGDDFVIETKSFEYFGEEQGSDSGSIDGFLCRVENYPLSKPMVDHNQKGIKAIGKREVGDGVTGDLLKGAGARGWNGQKWGLRWMGIDLILLAGGTPVNITVDIRGEAWPPKFRGNKLASFENARVTHSGMIMVTGNDRVVKGSIGRDIDAALVSQDASIVAPVREVGTKCSWNFARESVEGVKDQWVGGRGRPKFIGEGGVNKVDEKFIREEGDCFIVCVRGGDVIRSVRQGVGGTKILARDMLKGQVKLRQVK